MSRKSSAVSSGVSLGSHTVWRFTVNAMNTDAYVGIREWRFYDAGNNLISLAGATTSEGGAGSQGGNGASAPFDGSGATSWLRNGAPSWVQITLPAAISPSRMEFDCDTVTRAPVDFTVAGDGADLFHAWEPSWDATGATRSWPQTFGSNYKAYGWRVTAINGGSFAIMSEAEMHATIGGADICNGGAAWCSTNTGTGTVPASLFDNTTATHFDWTTAQLPGTVYYGFPTPTAVPAEFNLTEAFATADGYRDFTFFGTNDGTNLVTLKTITGITWTGPPQTQTWAVP
jgi:hypothetical protein